MAAAAQQAAEARGLAAHVPRPLQGLLQTQLGLLFRLAVRVSLAVFQQGMVTDLTGKIRDRLLPFRLVPGRAGGARGFRGGCLVSLSCTGGRGRGGVLPLPAVMSLLVGALFPGAASGGLLLRAAVQGRVLQGGETAVDLVSPAYSGCSRWPCGSRKPAPSSRASTTTSQASFQIRASRPLRRT